MPELLKNLYDKPLIKTLSEKIKEQYSDFDSDAFQRSVFARGWKQKELKQRMRHITECLHRYLPTDYSTAIDILKPVSEHFNGFEYMFFQDFVECYGLDYHQTSIEALEHFTKYASSEFAVRAFILQDEKRMMKQILTWARSDNHHVRRLASEGCRPRLPWAVALPSFKDDPRPILPVLKCLMADESEYVRRSVANNLNDISKDHPDIVLEWARRWSGKNRHTDSLIKHACRTLLKQGDQEALSLFGYSEAQHIKIEDLKTQKKVRAGERLNFSFVLKTDKQQLGRCRIEFAIDFARANGKHNRKVFKISEGEYPQTEKNIEKYFSFKKISTRRYYEGRHRLTIIVNGVDQITKNFFLEGVIK
jgi:3-methyladenine DNA glycosylase AlkC